MPRTTGRAGVVGMSHGGALAAGANLDLRPWRVLALILGAMLACIAALALATLPVPTAPSTRSVTLRRGLQGRSATDLPISLAATASSTVGASERSFWPVRHGAALLARGGAIHSTFTASGARLRVAQGTLSLSLAAVGRGQRLDRVAAVAPQGAAGQVLYRHRSISEFYRNGPYGLEQGFTLRKRPEAGTGSLVLALSVGGSLLPKQLGSQILFKTHTGAPALRYGQLSALDAAGRRLPAHLQIRNGTLQLLIDDSHARYPLRIDPFIQQGEKLTPNDKGAGFGLSVALSADGNTALFGGPGDNNEVGAAWVFTRSGSTWTQQGEKLTGGGEVSTCCGPRGRFGASVALSADGNTALIGGPGDDSIIGAAWVFTRSGSTWTQQGSKLTASDERGHGYFGNSVALSADGNTALIGGQAQNDESDSAAWVFTRSGSTWTQQGSKLTASDESGAPYFGKSVALSADGNTALIGGSGNVSPNNGPGAAWVFTRSGSTWTQQGGKLTASDESGEGEFGASVALSADGNTTLIGGPSDNNEVGAAWVFTRSGSAWTQQGSKLTPNDEGGGFGLSVALSADGNTALIGGPNDMKGEGAAWVFTRSGSTWTQGSQLTSNDEEEYSFGLSVALSADGNTALIGGPDDMNSEGAAWVFATASPANPTVESASPHTGATGGGTTVAITGTNFTGATAVKFGSTAATSFKVNSESSITAVSPPFTGRNAIAEVTITTPVGTSGRTIGDAFIYQPTVTKVEPNSGPAATLVTITGTAFTGHFRNGSDETFVRSVKFGSTKATFVVNSQTAITALAPPGVGTTNVTVETLGGTSARTPADQFAEAVQPCQIAGAGPPRNTLQEAVDAASAGATLNVKGTCYGDATISKNLKIVGKTNPHFGPATLNGGNHYLNPGSVIVNHGATVTITGLTITGGYNDEREPVAGIYNTAEKGGGIYNEGGSLTLTDSTVSGNTADAYTHDPPNPTYGGGGIYNGGGSLTLKNSTVARNTGPVYGGGIDNEGGSLKLTNSTVSENVVTHGDRGAGGSGSGGGIYNRGSASLTNSTVSANTGFGTGGGGGITNQGGSLDLTDSTVSGNTRPSGQGASGGGIANWSGGSVALNNSTVTGNQAAEQGGGIYDERGSVTLNNSTVSENKSLRGGGISNRGSVTLNNSNVARDTASGNGGGIYNRAALALNGTSSVTGNTASEHGGGIFNDETEGATISYGPEWSGTVSGNKPDDIFNF